MSDVIKANEIVAFAEYENKRLKKVTELTEKVPPTNRRYLKSS